MGKKKYMFFGNKIADLVKIKSSTKVQQRYKKLNYDNERYRVKKGQKG